MFSENLDKRRDETAGLGAGCQLGPEGPTGLGHVPLTAVGMLGSAHETGARPLGAPSSALPSPRSGACMSRSCVSRLGSSNQLQVLVKTIRSSVLPPAQCSRAKASRPRNLHFQPAVRRSLRTLPFEKSCRLRTCPRDQQSLGERPVWCPFGSCPQAVAVEAAVRGSLCLASSRARRWPHVHRCAAWCHR